MGSVAVDFFLKTDDNILFFAISHFNYTIIMTYYTENKF